jgi:hypothetical protein
VILPIQQQKTNILKGSKKMKIKRNLIALPAAAMILIAVQADARENGASGHRSASTSNQRGNTQDQLAASCTPASAKTDLDINNVRTTIMTGGDMWWDLTTAKYEIPKDGNAHSIFSGALWIGGLDAGGQLKVAGMTYRQTGNDFWPGPLDTTNISIEGSTCVAYDRHWKITRKQVEDFVAYNEDPTTVPGYSVPLVIQNWPGNGDASLGQGRYLAPFVDVDGDGIYNWSAGDFPAYDLKGTLGCSKFQLFGDQCLWWVFNDKGNVHSETGAASIGLEIHAQAFAFSTNDEINNMTFYSYKIINRATISLNDTYFGQWTDADLGAFDDDYVGCDVARGLGYTYNGDADDGTSPVPSVGTYGANPPAIGMDFFEGPLADPGDGIDNDRDGATDEIGEQIIMSKFVYYNNDFSIIGNPENATHFYNYLSGFWKDGSPFTYGGNAYGGSTPCDYMFPGNTDPDFVTPWDEATVGNVPADRRMMQSAGPFTLQPGAVNYITVGAVWARSANGGPAASVQLMRTTDDKAQRLFDNCFRTLDGPDAPDATIQEMDKELILYLTNKPSSNNYLERYQAYDPAIAYSSILGQIDSTYNFEGYQIFQLKDNTVTTGDLYNPDKARLIKQYDMRNGITTLVNREFDQALNADVPQEMTLGASDEGIMHSFNIVSDAFASGNSALVNHKTYYYMVISYAYNNYLDYDDDTFDPLNPLDPSNIGQKKPYLAGRRNVKIYKGIPHITSPEAGGTDQNANYNSGPKITRLEGAGNGTNNIELTTASVDAILAAPAVQYANQSWANTARADQITYENGRGPINVKVIDPLNVPDAEFTVQFVDNPNSAYQVASTPTEWILNQVEGSTVINSWRADTVINIASVFQNEQIIPEIGMSVTISQVNNPGLDLNPESNGYITSSMTFADPLKSWLSGLQDDDSQSGSNWIRAGSTSVASDPNDPCAAAFNDRKVGANFIDGSSYYEKVIDGTWAPYRLTSDIPATNSTCYTAGVAYNHVATMSGNKIENLANVDVVFTNDRSKWTRVPVFEMGSNPSLNSGQVKPMALRNSPSVDKYGRTNSPGGGIDNCDFISGTGMSWFPGYAINVETGERLNMAFGENSGLVAEHGRDMLWNPTENDFGQFGQNLFGGMHTVYVFGHNGNAFATSGSITGLPKDVPAYDYGKSIYEVITAAAAANDVTNWGEPFRDAMWASVSMLSEQFSTWNFDYTGNPLPCDVSVKLRVAKPYKRFLDGVTANFASGDSLNAPLNGNHPMYRFDTHDLKVGTNDNTSAVNALDLINVVPNPYYAYSGYETSQLDNRVKFTNLPEKCTIRIYTVSGTLIRKFTKDSPETSMDWDLKNQAGIPIASGLYIVHVNVDGVGEKILKWFGVMRPIDLDAY